MTSWVNTDESCLHRGWDRPICVIVSAASYLTWCGMPEAEAVPATGSFACPKCGSPRVRASRAKNLREGFFRAVGIHFYRCRDCRERGRLPRKAALSTTASEGSKRAVKRRDGLTIATAATSAALLAVVASRCVQR